MPQDTAPHPPITDYAPWLAQRRTLLEHEKELTRQRDRLNAERRRLPMVKVDKEYTFDGPDGPVSLRDLFDGRRQLIVYHFMFDPADETGCPGCTGYVNEIGDLSLLGKRDTTFVLVSRAPLAKLDAYRAAHGWTIPWYSSFGSDFNYDYHVTLDESVAPILHNFRTRSEIEAKNGPREIKGEAPGVSVFFTLGGDTYHTYSAYARGTEFIADAYSLLDLTPYGRQESFEDSPEGWPQHPTYG